MVHMDVQLFARLQSSQKMRLIDTPGWCGSGINHAAASSILRSSTTFVFVMPYSQLGDREDVAILDEILRVDPGITKRVDKIYLFLYIIGHIS